jgi:membrane protease YdiL (CAAX protease family)
VLRGTGTRAGGSNPRADPAFQFAACHANGGEWKAAGPVSLFETRASEFEHYGATAVGLGASQSLARVEGTTVRKLAILEPALVYALIVAYIWNLRYSHGGAWVVILGLMLLSHLARRENAYSLGFRTRHMGACWRELAPALAFLALLMLASGILLHTLRPIAVETALAAFVAYVPWGVFQQYVLNGYFLNRLDAVLGRRAASLISAALFCGVHTPNWFLMLVAFPAGYCSTRIYRRYRNLYFLGLAHATVGFLLFLVVPDSVSHHLKVGPGWFAH